MEEATKPRNVWEEMRKMTGTSGRWNYALIAVRNGVGLGLTMLNPTFTKVGGKDYLMYAAHVRSAKLMPAELDGIELSNVTELVKADTKLSEYWPSFTFSKEDKSRAAGDLVAYFEGAAYVTPEGEIHLPPALKDGSAAKALVDKIVEIGSAGQMIAKPEDLLELYQQRDAAMITAIEENFGFHKEEAALIASTVGTVISQGSILKAMKESYEEKHGKATNEEPAENENFVEDPDDEDGDGSDD